MLRDWLHGLNRNIVFCMTQAAEEQLSLHAMDLYSYVKIFMQFDDEFKTAIKDCTKDDGREL